MEPKEVLIKAKEEIETLGWCQGTAANKQGNRCMLGAMASVVGDLGWDQRMGEGYIKGGFYDRNATAIKALLVVTGGDPDEYVSIGAGVIADVNDDMDTTVQDVYNYFDKALAELGGLA